MLSSFSSLIPGNKIVPGFTLIAWFQNVFNTHFTDSVAGKTTSHIQAEEEVFIERRWRSVWVSCHQYEDEKTSNGGISFSSSFLMMILEGNQWETSFNWVKHLPFSLNLLLLSFFSILLFSESYCEKLNLQQRKTCWSLKSIGDYIMKKRMRRC